MVDLSAQVLPGSGFTFVEPIAINDVGEIVGNGTIANGDVHAVLLQPDGPCNSDCEAALTADRNSAAAAANQIFRNSNTAARERTPSTALERVRSQMRQQYHISGLGAPKQ